MNSRKNVDLEVVCDAVDGVEAHGGAVIVSIVGADPIEILESLDLNADEILDHLDLESVYDWLDIEDVKKHFDLVEG